MPDPQRPEGEKPTPKMELVATLDIAWEILCAGPVTPLRGAQLRGVIDHARAVVQRVGHEARPARKKTTEAPHA